MQNALVCLHRQALCSLLVLGTDGGVLHAKNLDPIIYMVRSTQTGLVLCAPTQRLASELLQPASANASCFRTYLTVAPSKDIEGKLYN